MRRFCHENGGKISGGWTQNYGYVVETERYEYCLRCNPVQGDYQAYLSCFDLDEQKINHAYLDVFLDWYEDGQHKTEHFMTGKTLGESGRGSGSDVPHFLCDHESGPRRQYRPRAVHGGRSAARTGGNDVPEPVPGRTAAGRTGTGRTAHPSWPTGRGRRKSSCAV